MDPAGGVTRGLDPLPGARSDWPAFCLHRIGHGQALYVAFEIGRYFEAHGDWHVGEWMTGLLARLVPQRQIIVRAPRTVEATLWHQTQPDRWIVHLANRTVPWTLPTHTRHATEIVPVHTIEVELSSPYAHPKVSARHAEVSWTQKDERLIVRLGAVGAYAAIVIDGDGA